MVRFPKRVLSAIRDSATMAAPDWVGALVAWASFGLRRLPARWGDAFSCAPACTKAQAPPSTFDPLGSHNMCSIAAALVVSLTHENRMKSEFELSRAIRQIAVPRPPARPPTAHPAASPLASRGRVAVGRDQAGPRLRELHGR